MDETGSSPDSWLLSLVTNVVSDIFHYLSATPPPSLIPSQSTWDTRSQPPVWCTGSHPVHHLQITLPKPPRLLGACDGWGGKGGGLHQPRRRGQGQICLSVLVTVKPLEAMRAVENGQILWGNKIRAVYFSLSLSLSPRLYF